MNIIIKTDEQRKQENKILHDFGYDHRTANKEAKEYAEATARITTEFMKRMEREQK
jgi:ssRNA-specific RNase YbeY (16S rRNA maturation enzyme)